MSASNVLLVVGDAKVGKRYLVSQLVGGETSSGATSSSSPSSATGIEVRPIDFDTKYYSATVAAHVLPSSHAQFVDEDATSLSAEARGEFAALDVQALVLVFSLARDSTFHSLANAWADFARDREPEVMMLVGNAEPTTDAAALAAQADLEQLARDWAIDHQIEYVRLPWNDTLRTSHTRLATPSATTASAPSAASSSRARSDSVDSTDGLEAASEPVGLARIRESLECHQWPDMAMKDRRHVAQAQAAAAAAASHMEDDHDSAADEAQEAAAFASMQLEHQQADEDEFAQFVGASAAAAAPNDTVAATASSSATAAASKSSAAAGSSSAARSASASAFANAFANAIRVPDSKPVSTLATGGDAISTVPTPDEIDSLSQHLSHISATAADQTVDADADDDDADAGEEAGASFDTLFEKITSMKASLNQVRADGSKLSDAERRAKAEENIRMLLKSMGMEDELDDEDD